MKLLRLSALIGMALMSACSGAVTVPPTAPTSAQQPLIHSSLTPLPRAQQDAIRASTPGYARWLRDVVARRRIGAARGDLWYAMSTRGHGGRAVRAVRQGQTVFALTECTTTYLNVSGTYDTSTDPIIDQSCSTTYVDDGIRTAGIGDGGGGGEPAPAQDPNLYGEPAKNFDTKTEQACKTGGKSTFISVSKWSNDTHAAPSPGHTECGPKNDEGSFLVLTGGKLYPFPGGCNFMVILTSQNISVNPASGNDTMLPQTSNADGIRINGNCTFDFVRI